MRCKPCKNLRWPTAAPVQSSLSTTDVQTRCKSNYLRSETGWISRHFTDTIIVSSSFTKNGLSDTSIGCQVSPIGLFSGLMAGYRGHCKHTINNRGPTKPPKAKRKKKRKRKRKKWGLFSTDPALYKLYRTKEKTVWWTERWTEVREMDAVHEMEGWRREMWRKIDGHADGKRGNAVISYPGRVKQGLPEKPFHRARVNTPRLPPST